MCGMTGAVGWFVGCGDSGGVVKLHGCVELGIMMLWQREVDGVAEKCVGRW